MSIRYIVRSPSLVLDEVLSAAIRDARDKRHEHANDAILDSIDVAFTTGLKALYDAAVDDSHEHDNETTLDDIEEALTTALKNTYDAAITTLNNHIANTSNPHSVTKEQVGTSLGQYPIPFIIPDDSGEYNSHFQINIVTGTNPTTGLVHSVESYTDQTNWTYWNGNNEVIVPSDGVLHIHQGARAVYIVPEDTMQFGTLYNVFLRIRNMNIGDYNAWTLLTKLNPSIRG
jgi:hypothetical protein